jgi:hypothetical protein
MIWEETRWESKVKEKWGKPSPDEPIAGNIQDYLDQLAKEAEELRQRRVDDRAA